MADVAVSATEDSFDAAAAPAAAAAATEGLIRDQAFGLMQRGVQAAGAWERALRACTIRG
eukprot:scaffold502_cov115-Isochrysis_galbana.AAC.3